MVFRAFNLHRYISNGFFYIFYKKLTNIYTDILDRHRHSSSGSINEIINETLQKFH